MGFTPSLRKKRMTEHCSSLVHVASEAAIFTSLLHRRVAFLHRTATCRPLFKPWMSLLPTYRTVERCFEFLSLFEVFHLTHLHMSSLICLSAIFYIVFAMKDDRFLGWYAWTLGWWALPGLGIYVTLTCLQALGVYHLARQGQRSAAVCYVPCCRNEGTISSAPAVVKGLILFITHFILDWSLIFFRHFVVLPVSYICSWAYLPLLQMVTPPVRDPVKWDL